MLLLLLLLSLLLILLLLYYYCYKGSDEITNAFFDHLNSLNYHLTTVTNINPQKHEPDKGLTYRQIENGSYFLEKNKPVSVMMGRQLVIPMGNKLVVVVFLLLLLLLLLFFFFVIIIIIIFIIIILILIIIIWPCSLLLRYFLDPWPIPIPPISSGTSFKTVPDCRVFSEMTGTGLDISSKSSDGCFSDS